MQKAFISAHTGILTKMEMNDRIFRKSEICHEFFLFADAAFPAGFSLQEYYLQKEESSPLQVIPSDFPASTCFCLPWPACLPASCG